MWNHFERLGAYLIPTAAQQQANAGGARLAENQRARERRAGHAVVLLLVVLGLGLHVKTTAEKWYWIPTDAVVIEKSQLRRNIEVRYRFSVPGRGEIISSRHMDRRSGAQAIVGRTLAIYYAPSNPNRTVPLMQQRETRIIATILLFVATVFFAFYGWRSRRSSGQPARAGA